MQKPKEGTKIKNCAARLFSEACKKKDANDSKLKIVQT